MTPIEWAWPSWRRIRPQGTAFPDRRPKNTHLRRLRSGRPVAALYAIGDIYLGRVNRLITHPLVGIGCVAYFSNAGLAEPEFEAVTGVCHRLWVDWQARSRSLIQIEAEDMALATQWVNDRLRTHFAACDGGET